MNGPLLLAKAGITHKGVRSFHMGIRMNSTEFTACRRKYEMKLHADLSEVIWENTKMAAKDAISGRDMRQKKKQEATIFMEYIRWFVLWCQIIYYLFIVINLKKSSNLMQGLL